MRTPYTATQTQIEQTRVIAEYDGWKFYNDNTEEYPKGYWQFAEVREFNFQLEDMDYLTSLDWLHPVAIDVLSKLHEDNSFKKLNIEATIECSCVKPPINGEYIYLFNAVYDGIVYLKNQEK